MNLASLIGTFVTKQLQKADTWLQVSLKGKDKGSVAAQDDAPVFSTIGETVGEEAETELGKDAGKARL